MAQGRGAAPAIGPSPPFGRARRPLIAVERQDAMLLILFAALITFPLQYAGRLFDNNTLTRWQWVFTSVSPATVFLLLVPGVALAQVLARFEPDDRRTPLLLFALAFLAALPAWREPEVIIDASRYFMQAKHLAQYGLSAFARSWGGEVAAWTDLPLVPLLYGLLFRGLGEQRTFIQLFTTVLFALAPVHLYHIGRRLWDRETGFLAGLLLLAMPYLLTQVPLMLVDVPALFLVTLSVHAYLDAMERGGAVRAGAAAAAIAAAALSKYSVWPMLLVLPLITFLRVRERREGALRRSAAMLAGAAILAGAVLLRHAEVVRDQLSLLRSYQWPALERWTESPASSFAFQIHPFVSLCAVLGVLQAARRRDLNFLIPGWFGLFVIVLQVARLRYLLPLLPFFALMAAYGLRMLFADACARRCAAYSAVAASLVLVFFGYLPFLERTTMANLRDAGAYLDSLPGDAVAVRVEPQSSSAGNTEMAIPLLDLYTRKRIFYEAHPLSRPDEQVILRSPLRFTWQQLPAFYSAGAVLSRPAPLAIIADGARSVPEAFSRAGRAREHPSTVFVADTGTFRYRTAVTVVP